MPQVMKEPIKDTLQDRISERTLGQIIEVPVPKVDPAESSCGTGSFWSAESSGEAGSPWSGENDTASTAATADGKLAGEARPPGSVQYSVATGSDFAEYRVEGDVGPSQPKACDTTTTAV